MNRPELPKVSLQKGAGGISAECPRCNHTYPLKYKYFGFVVRRDGGIKFHCTHQFGPTPDLHCNQDFIVLPPDGDEYEIGMVHES